MTSNHSEFTSKEFDLESKNTLIQEDFLSSNTDQILYDTFLSELKLVAEYDDRVFLLTNKNNLKLTEDENVKAYVFRVIKDVFNENKHVIYITDINDLPKNIQSSARQKPSSRVAKSYRISSSLTLDKYAQLEFNKSALMGAKVIINDGEEATYTPVFFYSASGFGKTHLLHAIANELEKKGKSCFYITPELFTRDIVLNLQNKNQQAIAKLIESLGQYDCLMFDDVQEYGSRDSTQSVLFNIFNNHIAKKKQIIVTADKEPRELGGFEDRFITRFSAGLVLQINRFNNNDVEEMFRFQFKQADIDPNIFDEECYSFFVRNFSSSVRAILGAINKIALFKKNDTDFRPTLTYLKRTVFQNTEADIDSITPEKIIETVGKYYNINKKDILGKTRLKPIVQARRIAMFVIRTNLDKTFQEIGDIFAQAHSSVMASVESIEAEAKTNNALKTALKKIDDNIRKLK
ncbi:DnaA ATPase domain-containing protein [Mycoplasma sp. 1573]